MQISSITDDAEWLAVTPGTVDNSGLGVYQASVNRAGLDDGIYAATINVSSSHGNAAIRVIMQVGTGVGSGEVGFVYVVMVDPDTFETIKDTRAQLVGGEYTYQLDDVPAGVYQLFAGTDADNDFFLCDGGEACGEYLTRDQPLQLIVSRNLDEVNFDVSFVTVIASDIQAADDNPDSKNAGIKRTRTKTVR